MLQEKNVLDFMPARLLADDARDGGSKKNNLVRKAFAILQAFRESEEWVTSLELSQRAGLPKASGHRLIQTLEEIGAVMRGPHGRYRLGMLLVTLSHNVAIRELLRQVSHQTLTELSSGMNLTVHMGKLEGGMVTYVAKVSTPTSFPTHTQVGSQLEAYCSGLGKVLLAALPDDQLESFILDGDLVALTPYTITDRARLRAELDRVRRQSFAIDDREAQVGMCCVAVPVCDADGRIVAAISGTDSAEKMTPERQSEVRDALVATASIISAKLDPRYAAENSRRRSNLLAGAHG